MTGAGTLVPKHPTLATGGTLSNRNMKLAFARMIVAGTPVQTLQMAMLAVISVLTQILRGRSKDWHASGERSRLTKMSITIDA